VKFRIESNGKFQYELGVLWLTTDTLSVIIQINNIYGELVDIYMLIFYNIKRKHS